MDTKQVKTYLQTAFELLEQNPNFYTEEGKNGVLSFAKYLDSFKHITTELHLAAVLQAQKINEEIILALINDIGRERGIKIVREITLKHRHHKKSYEQDGTQV